MIRGEEEENNGNCICWDSMDKDIWVAQKA